MSVHRWRIGVAVIAAVVGVVAFLPGGEDADRQATRKQVRERHTSPSIQAPKKQVHQTQPSPTIRTIRVGDEFTFTLRGPDDLKIFDIGPRVRVEVQRFYMDRGLTVAIRQLNPKGVWYTYTHAPNDGTWVDLPAGDQLRHSSPGLTQKQTQKVIVTGMKHRPSRQ